MCIRKKWFKYLFGGVHVVLSEVQRLVLAQFYPLVSDLYGNNNYITNTISIYQKCESDNFTTKGTHSNCHVKGRQMRLKSFSP